MRAAPAHVQLAARADWVSRWAAILAVSAQRAFASSLLELPLASKANGDEAEPELHEQCWPASFRRARQPFPLPGPGQDVTCVFFMGLRCVVLPATWLLPYDPCAIPGWSRRAGSFQYCTPGGAFDPAFVVQDFMGALEATKPDSRSRGKNHAAVVHAPLKNRKQHEENFARPS